VPGRPALTNRVANPVLRRLLLTRPGAGLGRRLAVVCYTGRRTGAPHELVVQYVRDDETVWVLVGAADTKTWWRNLREPADVELWPAGEHHAARAMALVGTERPAECAAGLAVYRAAVTAAPFDPAHVVLVRADLR
jgi:hypothetical protein